VVALIIAVLVFCAGGYAALRWAPPLQSTPVGRTAAIVVAVLFAAALVVLVLEVYELIRQLDRAGGEFVNAKSDIVAGSLAQAFADAGPLLGLAAAVHLLAPPPGEDGR
jgi:hypothetical protein